MGGLIENKANSVQLLLQLPAGTELGKIEVVLILSRVAGWVVQSDNKANSVQLPTGTELGNMIDI